MANLLDFCIKTYQNSTAQKRCSSGKGLKALQALLQLNKNFGLLGKLREWFFIQVRKLKVYFAVI